MVYRLQKTHYGIILIRLGKKSPVEKAMFIHQIIRQYSNKLENAFTVIQPNAIRIRSK